MRKKRMLISLLSLTVLLSIVACSSNNEKQDILELDTSKPENIAVEDSKEPVVRNIMDEFKELVAKEDTDLKSVASFMKENIADVTPEEASEMILKFEELQVSIRTEEEEKYLPDTIVQSMGTLSLEGTDFNDIESIKDDALKDLISETKDSGFKIEQAEGLYYPVIDYSFYQQFSSNSTEDIKEYITIMSVESDAIFAKDAALVISWKEVIKRTLTLEAFMEKYPDSKKIIEIKELYQRYEFISMHGLNNTPLFDYDTKLISEEAKNAFGVAMTNSIDSVYLKKIGEFIQLLTKNDYKLTEEVEVYRKANTNYGDSETVGEENRYAVAGVDDAQEFESIFEMLKQVLEEDDKATFSEYIAYPIKVNLNGKRTEIIDKDEFIKNFDLIITKEVKATFLDQEVKETFVNWKGVMVGQGELWFSQIAGTKHKYSVYGINN